MRRLAVLGVLAVVVLAGCGGGGRAPAHPARRLFIVSLPGVSWADVTDGSLPNLKTLTEQGASGNLATRIGRGETTIEAAYLTMGAGTRAVAPSESAGVALEQDEQYHGEPSAFVVARRLGEQPTGVAYLAIGATRDANVESAYDADIGTLGDALGRAGIDRAVIANADFGEGRADDGMYGRSAAALVMGSDGLVPHGTVGHELLIGDVDAPFGVRVDHAAVLDAVDAAWSDERTVVVVEASDLGRVRSYRGLATAARAKDMRIAALAEADALIGDLVGRLGDDDAILVVSPVAPAGSPDLGVVALRAPGVPHGLLRSATTRRNGYVQLTDVAPAVLDVLGVPAPSSVEGRPFTIAAQRDPHQIVELDEARRQADFRDRIVPATVTALIVFLALLSAATIVRRYLPAPVVRAIPVLAAGALGALPATFFGAVLGVRNMPAYVALLVAVGAVVAVISTLAERRRPGLGPIVGVSSVIGLIAADVLVGAPLQLNTVFGYSVAVAGRFAGLGNLAFALFGSGALVLAVLLAERSPRWGLRAAVGVLLAALLIDGLPNLGADVGGVLSMVPAFGLATLVLVGRRIGIKQVALAGVAAAAAVLTIAFLDLARPESSQTHLARLARHVLDWRWKPFIVSVTRRWSASFGRGETGAWVVLIVLVAAVVAMLLLRLVPHRQRRSLSPPERAAAVGLVVLALLGLVANDSSFAVPFTMLLVVAPVFIHRTITAEVVR